MVCHCSVPNGFPQPNTRIPHSATPPCHAKAPCHATPPCHAKSPCRAKSPCHAKAMTPSKRQQLALEALAGTETVSRLAGEHAVSRKFVYQQTAKVEEALDAAFSPKQPDDERVLFYLPVTKAPERSPWPTTWPCCLPGCARTCYRWPVRASSIVENFNSRLRNYFFLRHHPGPDYLARISHQPSTARPEVQPWLRRAARFILNVFTNTPTDESLALLATTELTTSRDDVGEKYGLVPW